MNNSYKENQARVKKLIQKGVEILAPESVVIGEEVNIDNIEPEVKIGPGVKILGAETMIGFRSEIQGAAVIKNCLIGRNCNISAGEYVNSVLLDCCSTVGWGRIRGNSAWEEESNSAHNCDTKTTILGYKTTLGSLINFCNVLMLGGTNPRMEVGAEVGSGTINFNFLPFGPTVGVLIKPSAVIGSMESPFLVCEGAPTRYVFIGGHCSIISPVVIGLGSVVAAKTRVNPGIYDEDKLIGGGNIERAFIEDVSKVKILKDIKPKYDILIRQIAITISYHRWCFTRIEWAKRNNIENFELKLIENFSKNVDKYLEALEAYGDNIAKYILASDSHSRPECLESNKKIATRWYENIKPNIKLVLNDYEGYAPAIEKFNSELDRATKKESINVNLFYTTLSKLNYNSIGVKTARDYFLRLTENIIAKLQF